MREGLRQRHRPTTPAMEVEAGKPAGRKRRKKSATPKGHDGGVDRISNLPNDNLCQIISLLPTKDGARTQVLASPWRHLWRSSTLNLNYNGLVAHRHEDGPTAFAQVLPRILSAHLGRVRRFCVPSYHLLGGRAEALDVWLRSSALDKLEELEFKFTPWSGSGTSPYLEENLVPPPASTFRFSATLLVFTLANVDLPDDMALHFPLLKHLTLRRVTISDRALQSLLSGCPAIECLLLNSLSGFRSIRIDSLTLRTICVHVYRTQELVIQNAPCLRRLLGVNFISDLQVLVINAPKLEALGCSLFQNFPSNRLVFSSTVMKGLPVDNLTMAVRTVKILAVYMYNLSLDTIIEYLRCFPCLEKLYIVADYLRPNNLWRRKHRNLIKCLDIRLKKIVLCYYLGSKPEVNFATFFVLNAKVLECMTFIVQDENCNENFIALQHEKLELEKRASRGAQFHFRTWEDFPVRNVRDMEDVQDMDLTDPFPC